MFIADYTTFKVNGEETRIRKRFEDVNKARMWLLSSADGNFSPYYHIDVVDRGLVQFINQQGETKFELALYDSDTKCFVVII